MIGSMVKIHTPELLYSQVKATAVGAVVEKSKLLVVIRLVGNKYNI